MNGESGPVCVIERTDDPDGVIKLLEARYGSTVATIQRNAPLRRV